MKGLLLIPALIALVAAYAAVDRDSGIGTWRRMRAELLSAQQRIEELRYEIASLQRSNEKLASDEFAIEAAIREDLELARPGERVLRLSNPQDTNPRFP